MGQVQPNSWIESSKLLPHGRSPWATRKEPIGLCLVMSWSALWRLNNKTYFTLLSSRLVSYPILQSSLVQYSYRWGMEKQEKLEKYVVGDLPTVFYIPDFITDSDQAQLLKQIYDAPASKWKLLKNRRLQNWGGVVHEKGLLPQTLPPWLADITERIYEESGLFPSAINHVLINEYLPHQGIMPHQDGPAYYPVVAILSLGSPVVMDFVPHSRLGLSKDTWKETVGDESSVEERVEEWSENHNHDPSSVLLMPRSLLIFKDAAYSDYLHGIKDDSEHPYEEVVNKCEALSEEGWGSETGMIHRNRSRISLTCRLVLKVHKNLFRF